MVLWAQTEFKVEPKEAEALWDNRSNEFPRRAGRRRKPKQHNRGNRDD
jgi:hypothetical protein